MDSLKTLMDKKNYELVIKMTEGSENADDIFYRIASFVALNKPKNALEEIEKHRVILESQLPLLMKVEIELLIALFEFGKAKERIKYYEELPYFSQEAEERLKSLKAHIDKAEKETYRQGSINEDKMREYLKSPREEIVLAGLQNLKEKDLRPYIVEIQNLLINAKKQSIRSFALMTLVDKKWDQKVRFLADNATIEVVPKDLKPPFVANSFKEVIQKMTEIYKDPVIINNAISVLSSYIIYCYPTQVEFDNDIMLEALLELSIRYLGIGDYKSLEERCFEKHLDLEEVRKTIQKMELSLSQF